MAKIERSKNAITGTIWGGLEKAASILLPFIVRTVLIKKLGAEYLGLNGLFSSILQVINLTELGFGAASVFAIYKTIAEDDYNTTGAILCYLRKIYRIIGFIIIGVGIITLPFLKYMISGHIPSDINIHILYLIYIFNTSISYLLFAHKRSLLMALQMNNIISKIGFTTNVLMYAGQIFMLLFTSNYYCYIVLMPLFTVISNVCCSVIVDKRYKEWLNGTSLNPEIKKDITKRLVPLMSTKIATVIVNAADTLVISTFLGLSYVAVYNNYYYIMNSISGFIIVMYAAMQAGIGNALIVDPHEKVMSDFKRLCFINNWLVAFCTACLICLYQPFMELWLGKEMMLPFGMVVLFGVYFYANNIWRVVVLYKDAAGIWREDMIRCYLSCFANLILNIILVNYIGLYGVIGSSVLANIMGLSWMGLILYRAVFKESAKLFYLSEWKATIISGIVCVICWIICGFSPDGISGFFIRGVLCTISSNLLLWLFYHRDETYKDASKWFVHKVMRR